LLEAHAGAIQFITIDIGANDALGCYDWNTGVWHNACVEGKLPHIESNLTYIIDALIEAAPGVPIAGMRYYDPFLGHWVLSEHGEDLARIDERALETMNAGLTSTYLTEGVPVADVAGPDFFNTADFTDMVVTKEWGEVPVNVANACAWTLFCTVGDIHPNMAGYGVIAAAFEAVLPT
jgi:lysophospholipase L1-like esterase